MHNHVLPYQRENKLEVILKRKKIRNTAEYDYVIDTMIAFHAENCIDDEALLLLKQLTGKFEEEHQK